MIRVFIGYDPREPIAYHVCANSIIRNTSKPVSLIPLALNAIKGYVEKHTDGSNDFIYSRFLVPWLMGFSGVGIFIDGDMLVNGDISELYGHADTYHAVHVVKHAYKTRAKSKYLGAKNEDYPRKNWSSVIVWNCQTTMHRVLTPENVASMTGAQLHRFTWLPDERIGDLPKEWNWLETEYDKNPKAKLIHYTLGTPCFDDYRDTDTSELWHSELQNCLTPISLPQYAEYRTRRPSNEREAT